MTLIAERPAKGEAPTKADVRLSVAEQDAILNVTAGESGKANVRGAQLTERPQAWNAQAEVD